MKLTMARERGMLWVYFGWFLFYWCSRVRDNHDKTYIAFVCRGKQLVLIHRRFLSFDEVKSLIILGIDLVTRRTIYMYQSGMDCDCVSYGCPVKFKNIQEANRRMDKELEYADGPMHFVRISKSEYEGATGFSRDLIMEAFEDGHPHSIHY